MALSPDKRDYRHVGIGLFHMTRGCWALATLAEALGKDLPGFRNVSLESLNCSELNTRLLPLNIDWRPPAGRHHGVQQSKGSTDR
jgi:hypothetical protein